MEPCALCLDPDADLQQSHVIPEFLYGAMYDDKHRFNVLTVLDGHKDRIQQKGLREPLLCRTCERKISVLERYASLVIKGGAKGLNGERQGDLVTVKGINYKVFKLFLLSILWRAGVSRHPYFEQVQLGPHLERLRTMLLAEDPGPFDLYPCIFFGLNWKQGETPGLMIQPHKGKVWGHTTYNFVLPGLKLVFFVSSHRLDAKQRRFPLQQDGSLLFQVRSPMDLPVLHGFMRKFEQQGRRPPLEPADEAEHQPKGDGDHD